MLQFLVEVDQIHLLHRFIEVLWKSCRLTEGERARRVAATGGPSNRRHRTHEEEEELYGSPYISSAPAYWHVYHHPAEEAQPIPLGSMEESVQRNTARDSPENADRSALARTWSGSTLNQSDAVLPERPPRARLPRTMSDASTLGAA
jgi:hypothetical protein